MSTNIPAIKRIVKLYCCYTGTEPFERPKSLREGCCGPSSFHMLYFFVGFGYLMSIINTISLAAETRSQFQSWVTLTAVFSIVFNVVVYTVTYYTILRRKSIVSTTFMFVLYSVVLLFDILSLIFPVAIDGHAPKDIPSYVTSCIMGLLNDIWIVYLFYITRRDLIQLKRGTASNDSNEKDVEYSAAEHDENAGKPLISK